MKSAWPNVSLGDLLRLERRPVEVRPDGLYQEIGIYCFGRGIFHKTPRSGFEVGEKNLYLLKEGDFILQVTFAWEGAIAVVSSHEDGMYGSTRYPTFRVDETRCLPEFLLYYFKTESGLQQLVRICPGSAGRNRVLSIRRIPEVMVPLPPIAVQRQVIAKIEAVSEAIREANILRQESLQASKQLWMRVANNVFTAAERTYPCRRLGDCVAVRGGGTPSKANPLYWSGSIPWVTPKDMKAREILDARNHISSEAVENSPAKLLEAGAVLVVVRGMILVHTVPSAVLRVHAAINQDMKALFPKCDITAEYLCAFLWAHNERIVSLVEKSTHDTRKLETAVLMGLQIPIPPPIEQERIVTYLTQFEKKVNALRMAQATTDAEIDSLMPSILNKTFRGDLGALASGSR